MTVRSMAPDEASLIEGILALSPGASAWSASTLLSLVNAGARVWVADRLLAAGQSEAPPEVTLQAEITGVHFGNGTVTPPASLQPELVYTPPQIFQAQLTNVLTVDGDRARVHVVETQQQVR